MRSLMRWLRGIARWCWREPDQLGRDLRLLPPMLWWTAYFRFRKRRASLASLVRTASCPVGERPDREQWLRVARLSRQASKLLGGADDGCLERALVSYRFLRRAGARPTIVLGMKPSPAGWQGHAWIELGGAPFADAGESGGASEFKVIARLDEEIRDAADVPANALAGLRR